MDPDSVTLDVDAGTLEGARARGLRGIGVAWRTKSASGADICHDPKPVGPLKRCVWAVAHGDLAADARAPSPLSSGSPRADKRHPAARSPCSTRTGRRSQLLISRSPRRPCSSRACSAPDAGPWICRPAPAKVAFTLHPEAIASVDCVGATCALAGGKLAVRGQTNLVSSVDVKLSFTRGVSFKRDEHVESRATLRLSVLHCPMSFAAGPPLRGLDSALTVLRFEGRCADDVSELHFLEGNRPLEVLRTEVQAGTAWAVLRLGRVTANEISVTALRGGSSEIPVAVGRTATRAAPDVRSVLEIPGLPRLAFIPSNRGAVVHVPPVGNDASLVLLPLDGVYSTETRGHSTLIRNRRRVRSRRFHAAFRLPRLHALPPALRDTDLAILEDPLGRPIHEVNIPAPLARHPRPPRTARPGRVRQESRQTATRLVPGETARLPYAMRDGCRLIVHRERLSAEYGTQKLASRSTCSAPTAAPAAKRTPLDLQTLVLRAGQEPLEAWIHGVVRAVRPHRRATLARRRRDPLHRRRGDADDGARAQSGRRSSARGARACTRRPPSRRGLYQLRRRGSTPASCRSTSA